MLAMQVDFGVLDVSNDVKLITDQYLLLFQDFLLFSCSLHGVSSTENHTLKRE